MKKILLSLSLAVSLYAQEVVETSTEKDSLHLDYNYLTTLEKGLKRDFYINEYLKTDITSEEAYSILELINNMNDELFINFAKKYKDDETLAVAQCMKMDSKDLVTSYADCIKVGLSLEDASKLTSVDIDLISQKLNNKYPAFVKKLKVISSSIPFTKLIIQKQEIYYDIFLNVSTQFREKYFNYKLPNRTFQKIFENKDLFNEFLDVSIKNPNLDKLNKSLLNIDDTKLSVNSSFLLGLNAYNFSNNDKAITYLNNALNKTNDIYEKSKILFWKYIISKESTNLEELIKLNSFSFYSLFANELLQKKQKNLNETFKNSKFEKIYKNSDKDRKALLFSIIKSKSDFDANKISTDYKIGASQLSQSTLKTISILLNEEYNLEKQFILEDSLRYANMHLNSLEKFSTNPVKLFLVYSLEKHDLKLVSKFDSFDITDLKELLVLEYLKSSKELKEFISYFYLYNKFFNKEDIFKISSIFETLVQSNLIKSEQDLK